MTDPAVLLDLLSACVCAQLAESIGGSPATCCVVASPPVIPNCCEGFAWVRAVGISPTEAFPSPGYAPSRCTTPDWILAVEMGVSRCAAKVCDELGNPCCDNEATATAIALSDYAALREAFLCCFTEAAELQLDLVEIGPWVPGTPEGTCVQSTMTGNIRFTLS